MNVEAFVVLPDATAMYLFEKERDDARVLKYTAPWNPVDRVTLEIASRITAPGPNVGGGGIITGADIHTSGARLLLRTYLGAFEAVLDPTAGIAGVDADSFTEVFRPADEPQGEAIAYDEAGTGHLDALGEPRPRAQPTAASRCVSLKERRGQGNAASSHAAL